MVTGKSVSSLSQR